jgi:hypothetical protein
MRPVPSPPLDSLRIVVDPVALADGRRRRWCASARISGVRDGMPFTMVVDLFEQAFDSQDRALRYGALKAEARMLEMLERGRLP